jgi:hypothetical protein
MQETRIPIDGEKLAKRWGILSIDLLFMMMNHELKAIDQLGDYVDIDIVFEVYGEDKENFDFPSLMFSLADVQKLEDEYLGDHLSMKRCVIRGQSLKNKWDMDGAEIFSIAFQEGWDFHDPFGFPIKEYYEFVLKLCNDQILKISDVLFELSDVEKFEREAGLQLSKRNEIVADSPFPEDKMDEKDGIPLISFYKNGQKWMIGKSRKEIILDELKGFEFIGFLIRNEGEEIDVFEVESLGQVAPNESNSDHGYIPEGIQISTNKLINESYSGDGSEGGSQYDYQEVSEFLPQDLIDKATKKDIKNAINEAKKQLSSVKDESKVLEIKEKIRSLENYLNEAKGPINKSSNFRSKRLENCRTNVRKRIKKALDNIEREIPYMKDYLNDKTIKTGSKCNYEQDGSKPAKWILDPPKLN